MCYRCGIVAFAAVASSLSWRHDSWKHDSWKRARRQHSVRMEGWGIALDSGQKIAVEGLEEINSLSLKMRCNQLVLLVLRTFSPHP